MAREEYPGAPPAPGECPQCRSRLSGQWRREVRFGSYREAEAGRRWLRIDGRPRDEGRAIGRWLREQRPAVKALLDEDAETLRALMETFDAALLVEVTDGAPELAGGAQTEVAAG